MKIIGSIIISLCILFLFILIGGVIMKIVKSLISKFSALCKKTTWLAVSIGILLLVCLTMLCLYFRYVSGNFSSNPNDWGAFGAYLGSISGLLAFSGVLYTVIQSNKVHKENSERDVFFKLLELHNNKMRSIEFDGKTGVEAFKGIAIIANKNLNVMILIEIIISNLLDKETNKLKTDVDIEKVENILSFVFDHFFDGGICYNRHKGRDMLFCNNLKNMISSILRFKKGEYGLITDINNCNDGSFKIAPYIKEYNVSNDSIIESMGIIADYIYKEYGHMLGHYFRNMYYVMTAVDSFDEKEKYIGIFRAQLSRYELVLMLFNAFSSNSSKQLIDLLIEFDVFKDLYPEDLSIISLLINEANFDSHIKSQDRMRRIIKELLVTH